MAARAIDTWPTRRLNAKGRPTVYWHGITRLPAENIDLFERITRRA
jgi:hypothetical protein